MAGTIKGCWRWFTHSVAKPRMRKGVVLFLATFLLYISLSPFYVRNPNTGSRFMLTKAVVLYGTFNVSYSDFKYYNGLDYAYKDGKYYSDKPPLPSFLVTPLYAFGRVLYGLGVVAPLPNHIAMEEDLNSVLLISLFICALSAAGVVRMRDLLLLLGFSDGSSTATALVYATFTIFAVYAGVLFAHAFSATFVIFSLYHAVLFANRGRAADAVLSGFFCGCAVASAYIAAVLTPFIIAYFLAKRKLSAASILFFAGAALPLAFVAFYNWSCFGSPLSTGYEYSAFKDSIHFNNPIQEGLYHLTFSSWRGLFFYNPVLLLSFLGAVLAWKRGLKAEALVFSSAPIALLLAVARYSYFWGGLCYGPRHLVSSIPMLSLLLAPVLEEARELSKRSVFLLVAFFFGTSVSLFHTMLGLLVEPFPYPELNRNPIYEIVLPKLLSSGIHPSSIAATLSPIAFYAVVTAAVVLLLAGFNAAKFDGEKLRDESSS